MDVQVPALLPDIIFKFLLLLPVESLFRCKSVCNDWYKLITHETFVKSHLAQKKKCLFYKRNDVLNTCCVNNLLLANPMSKPSIHYPLIVDDFARLVGSANRLICIVQHEGISIYNPTTRICNRVYGGFVAPVHDYQVAYGFGYDSYTDDYKVVAVRKSNNKVKVYSLKTGIWKKVSDFPDAYLLEDGVFLNGCIHWLDYLPNNLPTIVSFDLGVLGDRLCVLSSYGKKSVTDIWVMQDDSWTKSLSIMYPEDHDGWGRFWQTYWMSNDGKILIRFDASLVSPIGPGICYRLRSWKVKSRMGESSSSAI
ncbi:F-box associated interaction domain-containing protein [Artemisia annua]|uniref:F-box associated interaction domain-containing protein n=1 Tax=Artemisia annua TaxID=35608 RepID=A0A2U1PUR0_ARTAN|nr:F-box associated interaction domain-containing protein [Artemisia annua]